MQGFDERIFMIYGEIPALILRGQNLPSIITSLFIHVDFWHIFGNMFYLFIFGDNVEDQFGHLKFLFFYVVFGILGGLAHSTIAVLFGGGDQLIPAVGASGAVAGILGAYIIFYPQARIVSLVPSYFFVRLARIPAYIFIGFWFIFQILYSGGSSSVAYVAHIGGFAGGLITAVMIKAAKK